MEEEPDYTPIGSRFRKRTAIYLLLFLFLVGFLVIWFSRISVAENLVATELDKLDVQASYEIADIGFSKQVIRNLVLGDPEQPDLTAELVEIGNSITTSGPNISWVRAKNVKLFGRLVDGKLSFGELDKFTDPDDDSPLALPAIWLGIESGRARIDSEYGAIGVTLNGEGQLQRNFSGEIAAISDDLAVAGCRLSEVSFFGNIAINDKKPRLKGPLRLPSARCANDNFSSEDIAAQINVSLSEDFTSWEGDVGLIGGPVRYAAYSSQEVKTSFGFSGDLNQSSGNIELTARGLVSPYGGANVAQINGPLRLAYGENGFAANFEGQSAVRAVRLSKSLKGQLNAIATSTSQTPVGPIMGKLATAVNRASDNIDLRSNLRVESGAAGTNLLLETLDASSRSGATATLNAPLALIFDDNGFAMGGDGNFGLSGGGFPQLNMALKSGSLTSGLSGQINMAPYAAGASKLTVPALRFSAARGGGTNIDGRIILSGPLPDGQVTGLQLPINGRIDARGGFALFRQCVTVQFASMRISSLSAGPTRSTLCPQGGAIVSGNQNRTNIAARADGLDLNGLVGETPLSIRSGNFGFSLSDGMQANNVAVQLGAGDSISRLNMELLSVAFGREIAGKITGGNGQIANVPLLMEDVEGEWRFSNGELLADAKLRVRDAQTEERFRPLKSDDIFLKFAKGEITATGNLFEPTTETQVASVNISHLLENATGSAILNVPEIRFHERFQPELLTPLTLGVVANLEGSINGQGQINWDNSDDGTKSSGVFRSDGLNLAAAFGPVTGLSGEINFIDLLSLETAPGQMVQMAEVNPGVAVFNGILSYRLLPDFKMEIAGGKWPFAGGNLLLEPTVLDLGDEAERRLVFTVEGIDAAQFLTQFDFENMAATGVFDGKLPMVFDQDGGRIAGGYLAAREGGGSLSYIGELTYEDMGVFANFAFNALKSVKYRNLTIGMDGAIDGEIVTEVKFAGLQQGDTASKNFITKQLAKVPIEFNVRIQAPFMQLMSSAKAYYEPEILVGQNLPALVRAKEARASDAAKKIEEIDE